MLSQLKSPGRLFIPVGEKDATQYIWVIDKDKDGEVKRKREYGVRVKSVPCLFYALIRDRTVSIGFFDDMHIPLSYLPVPSAL